MLEYGGQPILEQHVVIDNRRKGVKQGAIINKVPEVRL